MNYDSLDLAILKTITTNKKHAIDFANECDTKIFSSDVWNFANLVVGYVKTFQDVPTLRVLIEKLAKGNNNQLIKYTNEIWNDISSFQYDEKEFKHDLIKLKNKYAQKQIALLKNNLNVDENNIDTPKAIKDLEKTLHNIRQLDATKTFKSKNIKEFLPEFVEKINAKRENPNIDKGILTKYWFFDFATNGVKPADFVIIAGESGFGKSLFLNNIAVQVWLQDNNIENSDLNNFTAGKDVIYFSLEMPYEDCFNRLLSRLSGVPSRNIENAKLSKEELNKIKKCIDFIKHYPYQFKIVDIADACANDLEAILIDTGENFDAIFIDYLGIMKPNKDEGDQDWLKQGVIAYETRAIARKYSKPIFSAVQLNRKSTAKEPSENIGLSRLARSGTIATHATHVIQIENRPNEEKYPDFIWHFIKNRKGPKGKGKCIKNLGCATLLDDPSTNNLGDKEDEYIINEYFRDLDDISDECEKLEL